MKGSKLAVVIAAAGILAATAHAQFLDFKLTAHQQGLAGEEVKPDVYKFTIDKMRVTTADILNLVASYYGTNFPAGARLYKPDDGLVQVLDTNGVVLLAIDSDVFDLDGSDGVYAGTDKQKPDGGGSFKGLIYVSMMLDVDEGNHLNLTGLAKLQRSESYGKGTFKFTVKMQAAGEGALGGEHSLISGSVTAKDSGATEEIPPAGDSSGRSDSRHSLVDYMLDPRYLTPVGTP